MDGLSVGMAADSLKFATLGMAVGTAAGGLTEALADLVLEALQLDINPTGRSDSEIPALFATVVIRGGVSVMGYLLAERLMRNVNTRRDDPTEGAYFAFAFGASQARFYAATRQMGMVISSGRLWNAGGSDSGSGTDKPCCNSCEGK